MDANHLCISYLSAELEWGSSRWWGGRGPLILKSVKLYYTYQLSYYTHLSEHKATPRQTTIDISHGHFAL